MEIQLSYAGDDPVGSEGDLNHLFDGLNTRRGLRNFLLTGAKAEIAKRYRRIMSMVMGISRHYRRH